MSYNIFTEGGALPEVAPWRNRKAVLFATIAAQTPDVVGLQEVSLAQYEQLQARFPGYGFCWAATMRDSAGYWLGNAIMYKQSALVRRGNCSWATLPRVNADGYIRNRVWATLELIDDSARTFVFVNTHYAHDSWQSRRDSSYQIMADMGVPSPGPVTLPDALVSEARQASETSSTALPSGPVVLVGDFNAAGHTAPISHFVNNGLVNLSVCDWNGVAPAPPTSTIHADHCIDHILATSGTAVSSTRVGDVVSQVADVLFVALPSGVTVPLMSTRTTYPSDHFGMVVTIAGLFGP